MPVQVDLQILISNHLRSSTGPAQYSQYSLEQHFRGEGFGHIVVAAQLKPPDDVFIRIVGGEKDDGGVPLLLEPGAQVQSAAVGQTDVQQAQVKPDGLPKLLGLGGTASQRHGVAVLLQGGLQGLPQKHIIFYQQKLGHKYLLK